jgi:ribonuclease J
MSKSKLKVIPLGGLNQIGKNMLVLEYENDILVIDAGLMFPGEDLYGIDLVIPDFSYLVQKKDKIRGIVITHGHEDHTGALPYLLKEIGNVPIYATKLTHGMISVKLKEAKLLSGAKQKVIAPGVKVPLGKFRIELYNVCHSILDAVGVIINTPVGVVIHSGDFKLDYTPVDGKPTNLSRLSQAGSEGVLLFLSDSTYAELPGYTPSEKVVGETLERIIARSEGRVIVTTFSSLISRIQQVIDAAAKHDRKVFIVGRSMTETVKMSAELGYLKVPDGIIGRLDESRSLPHKKVVFITTGSQGEPTSALVRMAHQDHSQVKIQKGDTVILSATPIPGNEALVNRTLDELFKRGANVIYDRIEKVHVHGHASQEELKLVLNLVKPRYFMPVHGEYRHLSLHAGLAETVGIPHERIFVMENGDVLELSSNFAKISGSVKSGDVYIDGASVGDVNHAVLNERRLIARDGIAVVVIPVDKNTGKLAGRPDVISRGFIDIKDAKDIIEQMRNSLVERLGHESNLLNKEVVAAAVKDIVNAVIYRKIKRKPLVVPVTVKV